jgi:hypothetical protein
VSVKWLSVKWLSVKWLLVKWLSVKWLLVKWLSSDPNPITQKSNIQNQTIV